MITEKTNRQNFSKIQPIPKPLMSELDRGKFIFSHYAQFLGVDPKFALAKLPANLQVYRSFDEFLIALSRRETAAELELDALFRCF